MKPAIDQRWLWSKSDYEFIAEIVRIGEKSSFNGLLSIEAKCIQRIGVSCTWDEFQVCEMVMDGYFIVEVIAVDDPFAALKVVQDVGGYFSLGHIIRRRLEYCRYYYLEGQDSP